MELRKDSDTVEAWLCDVCTLEPDARVDRVQLFRSYERYCDESERTALSKNGFYRALRAKGYQEVVIHGKRCFKGIVLGAGFEQGVLHPDFVKVEEADEIPFAKVQHGGNEGATSKVQTAPIKTA